MTDVMGKGRVDHDLGCSNGQMGLCQLGQGGLKSSSDVLKALETIADKFLVLGKEILSVRGDSEISSRQCNKLNR